MNPGFQEGRRPRANAVASLAATGQMSPLGRRPGVGFAAHGQHPGAASRPGPRPMSAKLTAAVNLRNNATQRAMHQVVRKAKDLVRLPYSSYQPGTPGRQPWTKGTDIDGQIWYRTQVQELWVYSHQIDRLGTMEFKLYNPRTKVWVEFKPVGYIPGKDAFRATASATGEFGRVYGNTLAVTAASFATLGIAAEFEVGSAVLASSRGVLIRYGSIASGQAARFGSFAYSQGAKFGAQVIEEFTIKNFFAKALLDGTVQLGSGILTKHDVGKSLNDINIISMLVAGVMPGEGFRPALRNSIITSTFKVTGERDEKGFHLYRELPDFTSITGVGKYLLNIGTGTAGDLVKLKTGASTAPIFRAATRVMAQSESAILHWFSANRVMLGTMVTIGGSSLIDAIKDEEKERMIGKLEKMQDKKHHPTQIASKKTNRE